MTAWLLPASAAAVWAGILAWPWLEAHSIRPVAVVAIGVLALAAGIALAPRVRRDLPAAARLAAGAPSPLEPLAARRLVAGRGPVWATAALAIAGLLLLGAGAAGLQRSRLEASLLRELVGERVRIVGALRTDPRPGRFGWWAIAGASSVSRAAGDVAVGDAVWIRGEGPPPPAVRGDLVELACTISLPGDEVFAAALERRGVAVLADAGSVRRLGPPPGAFAAAASALRAAVTRSAEALFPPRQAGLLLGLAIGDDTRLEPGLERDFRATGLGHLLVVSGGNLAMVLAPLLGLAMLLRLPMPVRFVLGVTAIAFFVVLTGMESSVLRAGAMATLALTGVLLGRPAGTASVLSGAVVLLLLIDPRLAWSVAFQLSVAATGGMVALAGPLADRMGWLPRPLAVTAGATVAAQAGVFPLLLFYFHEVPLVALVANVLAFPAVAPAMLLGLAAAGVGTVWPPAGRLLAGLALPPLHYLEEVADRLASAPVAWVTSGGGVAVLVLGTATVAAAAWWVRRRRVPRAARVVALGLLPLLVWASALRAGPPGELVVRFLDVGQGDAALLSTPEGAHVLIDGGPEEEPVARALASLGVKRVDVLVASHAHADHVVGLPAVLTRFPVGLVLEPGCPSDSGPYLALRSAIEEEGLPVRHPRAGETIRVGDLRLDVLSPDACWTGTESDSNNDSLVLRATYAGHTILFATEPEEPAQEAILGRGVDLTAEVLKVPHHGARTSVPGFFEAVDADLAVVSVGPNPYGHPVPEVLDWIRAAGAQVLRTDRLGDITMWFGPEGVRVGYGST